MTEPPVIFLAFANQYDSRWRYLRYLPDEILGLQDILDDAHKRGLCELVIRTNATVTVILEKFEEYRDRVAVFHFGEHADSGGLLFESRAGDDAPADAGGLATVLGQRAGLQLVFLNGCSTRPQVQRLLDAGSPPSSPPRGRSTTGSRRSSLLPSTGRWPLGRA